MSESINEQIARRVMGWKDAKDFQKWDTLKGFTLDKAYWNPTTSNADAFEVLRECIAKRSVICWFARGRWFVGGGEDQVSAMCGDVASDATSLPQAICAFALKLFPEL